MGPRILLAFDADILGHLLMANIMGGEGLKAQVVTPEIENVFRFQIKIGSLFKRGFSSPGN